MPTSLSSFLGTTYEGSQGSQGLQGLSNQGAQGLQGLQGVQGIQGLQGLQGVQGLQGLSNQGVQGLQGLSNQGVQGLQGLQGSQGIQGLQGLQGVQGLQGLSNQGVQGTAGSAAAGGGGGSGTFDTGISTSIYVSVTSGIGTNTTTSNDIFVGPGIGYSFPSTAGKEYVIESIHVSNTFSNELYLSARQDFNIASNTWRAVPITQRLIVPYQGAVELINQPMIASPQDILRFQALSDVGNTAVGIDGGLDAFIVYSEKTDTNYVGVGSTVASTSGAEVFVSSAYPSVIQSIRLCNYNLNIDVDTSVSIYRGGTAGLIVSTGVRQGYLIFNITIPKNSVIEILDKPKYLAKNDSIVATASTTNSISVCLSGKYIV